MLLSKIIKSSQRLCLLYIVLLSSHNSFAGKEIIHHVNPYYATEAAFYDERGDKRYLEEFENNTVLLVFWATWCGTCVNEMYSLDVLAKDFRKLPFKVIALSQDFQGIEAVSEFYKNHEIRHLDAFHDYRNNVFREMKVAGLPCAFLIKPDNKVVATFKGEIKWHDDKVRDIILAAIPGTPEIPRNTYKELSLGSEISKKLEDQQVTANINEEKSSNNEKSTKNNDEKSVKERKHDNRTKTSN